METKKCKRCGAELPLSEFSANKNSGDGYARICKKCLAESHRQGAETKRMNNAAVNAADPNRPLAAFTPRQLMEELALRGYGGELTYVQRIKLTAV